MRNFSTAAATLETVRKVGFYPSERIASRLAAKIGYVLELNPSQVNLLSSALSHGITDHCEELGGYTPSEMRVIRDFSNWWSVTSTDDLDQKSFVVCCLNTGRSLVVVSKRSVTLNEIRFVREWQVTSWRTAVKQDVIDMI
jgi:hypothetical protein